MDKYQELREKGKNLVEAIVGIHEGAAVDKCIAAGFYYRYLSMDGQYGMITSDCRMDRVGLHVMDGVVTAASIG
jgi:alpha-acetolactate decarboxylase